VSRLSAARSCIAALLLPAAAAATTADEAVFRYDPEKIEVGTVYHYVKSNIDGSRPSRIALYVAATDRLESFKWHAGASQAALVKAQMDWQLFSVRLFESWRVQEDGEHHLMATLTYRDDEGDYTVSIGPQARVQIDNWPWHSYDFDFASLNFCMRHRVDPEAPFTFGVADVVRSADGIAFADKGPVTMTFEREEARHDVACRRYRVDGEGLEDRGGVIWVDRDALHIVDYEIDLPDEPGFESGKLRLETVGRMSREEWQTFMNEQLARDG
jgi:hypothetical protein